MIAWNPAWQRKPNTRKWYLLSELVRATGLPINTIRSEMRAGRLPAIRTETRRFKQVWRFRAEDVEKWLRWRLERDAARLVR